MPRKKTKRGEKEERDEKKIRGIYIIKKKERKTEQSASHHFFTAYVLLFC